MKYLVTGGAGFIGSHITDALVAAGHQVVVLDNLSSGHKANLSNVWNRIEFVEGDVRDPEACLRAAEGCDGIFHEAALVSVPDSVNRPRDNHDINITGTLNILEAARSNGVKRVAFASSAAIYGDNPELPKRETMLPEPKSPYALAKITGEYYLKVYAECFGLETVALRYFNVFGPRQDPSSMYSGVISIFSERIAKGLPITIYGDGQQTRDFVNVADVVQANLLAMKVGCQKSEIKGQRTAQSLATCPLSAAPKPSDEGWSPATFSIFNIATGRQTTLLNLVSALGELCSVEPEIAFSRLRPGDIQHSLADVSMIEKTMGYSPQVQLKGGLEFLVKTEQLVHP
jgi:UDP-glucose 4-epimerase